MKRKLLKPIAVALLLAISPMATGCYGSFGATRVIWQLNGDLVDNKFVTWLLFLVFVILPVYEIALIVDVFFLNLLEFWTGSNLLVQKGEEVPEKVVQLDDGTMLVMNRDAADGMRFEIIQEGEAHEFELFMNHDGAMLQKDGEAVGVLTEDDGGVSIFDSEGKLLDSMAPAEQNEAVAAYEEKGAAGLVGWKKDQQIAEYGIGMR